MDKGIILFDIDRTIFDTAKFKESLVANISGVLGGVKAVKIKNAMNDFISSLEADREFDPEKFAKYICETFNFKNQSQLLDIFYSNKNPHWYKDFVFPDFIQALKKLKGKFLFGIYSEGTKKFQNYKFKSMELTKYLDKSLIFILDHKTNPEAVSKIPKGAIVVDDKESVCRYLSGNNIKVIWLNRKTDMKSPEFMTIHNLIQLPEILL